MSTAMVVYSGVALLLGIHALVRIALLHPRTGEHIERSDRVVLGATALVASAAWALLLPLFLLGWIGSGQARAQAVEALHWLQALPPRLMPWRRLRHSTR